MPIYNPYISHILLFNELTVNPEPCYLFITVTLLEYSKKLQIRAKNVEQYNTIFGPRN